MSEETLLPRRHYREAGGGAGDKLVRVVRLVTKGSDESWKYGHVVVVVV